MSSTSRDHAKKVVERIKKAYDLRSDAAFADMMGLASSTPNTWKTRDSLDHDLIMQKCADLNLEWVFRGRGEPRFDDNVSDAIVRYESKTSVAVPIYSDRLGAGTGDEPRDEIVSYGRFFEDWLRSAVGVQPDRAFVAPVRGRSMENLLMDGDLVLCEHVEEINYEDIYACRLNNELKIKHVHRNGSTIVLRPENDKYPTVEVGAGDDFAAVGRVKRRIVR